MPQPCLGVASAAWEKDYPEVFHRDVFMNEVFPSLADVILTQMMKATGSVIELMLEDQVLAADSASNAWEALRTFAK